MNELLQLMAVVTAIFGCGLMLYAWWNDVDEVEFRAAAPRTSVPKAEHPAVVAEALDARIHVSDDGVTFEHRRPRASVRRRADTIVFAPWSSIVGARSSAQEIRIQVVGYSSPRDVHADPWGASLKRGHESVAAAIVAVIWSRAAGAEAVPILATVDNHPGATTPAVAPTHRAPDLEMPEAPFEQANSVYWPSFPPTLLRKMSRLVRQSGSGGLYEGLL